MSCELIKTTKFYSSKEHELLESTFAEIKLIGTLLNNIRESAYRQVKGLEDAFSMLDNADATSVLNYSTEALADEINLLLLATDKLESLEKSILEIIEPVEKYQAEQNADNMG